MPGRSRFRLYVRFFSLVTLFASFRVFRGLNHMLR